ncbi:hypothetical protein CXX84_02085 [Arthrobacter sp. AFG7.2]|uniref:DUF2306 domain-containing protein n=1 Tax=Arthrobacter sp. AFG7.2 TaxID=1688693 RepID=UPI000C9DEF63|nr:DUF2306 domain-containing protein [Arthrobacter sp. AFG7.2]PNI10282.1 hypothetical protein CXX84_02085 [Arthrobacter sp. AFG7.2]
MEQWNVLVVSHVIAALYSVAIGPLQILRRRRDRVHRTLGLLWVAAMYYVCFSSFWIVTDGHFNWLHGLSTFTLITVTLGLISAIRGNIPAHLGNMVGSYIGIVIAFGFAVGVPSRSIPQFLMTDPGTAIFVAILVLLSVGAVYLSLARGERRSTPLGTGGARTPAVPLHVRHSVQPVLKGPSKT